MDVEKLEHACMVVRQDDAALVIDPGGFTRPVDAVGVVAVVITHEHPDHVTREQLDRILAANPDALVFGPKGVATALAAGGGTDPTPTVDVVTDGDTRQVGPFRLTFHGTRHNPIHESVPVVDNTGVMVNGLLFYPGDSWTEPGVPVPVLAAPVGAPWLRIGDAMDYVSAIAPARAFPVHEWTLSATGLDMHTSRLREMTDRLDPAGTTITLAPGERLTLD